MPANDNPYNLSPETIEKLLNLAATLKKNATVDMPKEAVDEKVTPFPDSPYFQELHAIAKKVDTYCSNCVLRCVLLHNLGLTYSVAVSLTNGGSDMLVVTLKGISPSCSTAYQLNTTMSIQELSTTYAADSVLKCRINDMFERMVKGLEQFEEKAQQRP